MASLLQCCSGICQSGDRGGAGICTQCGSLGLNHAITSNWVCCRSFQSVIHLFIVTLYKCSWQWLAKCCVGLYLVSSCHGVQMPADPPIATLANATLAYVCGTCHCYPEWHNFPVYEGTLRHSALQTLQHINQLPYNAVPYRPIQSFEHSMYPYQQQLHRCLLKQYCVIWNLRLKSPSEESGCVNSQGLLTFDLDLAGKD